MTLLDRLERRFRRYAVPDVTVALIAGQVACYVVAQIRPDVLERIAFIPNDFLAGDWWRVVSFVFQPPMTNPVFVIFCWYLFYLMGTTLEQTWGTFRYNVFLLVGYFATVGAAFLVPWAPASVAFLQGSVYLAFAYLYPDFQLMLFFLLPIRIKWLALLTWIGYGLAFLAGPMVVRVLIGASVVNFFLFFGLPILRRMRSSHRRMHGQVKQITQRKRPRHRCVVCGATNLTNPTMDFRYCSQCAGNPCYCETHLRNHEHIRSNGQAVPTDSPTEP